jgi:hypothetical protein
LRVALTIIFYGAPPSRTAEDGPWSPLTVSSELCQPCAVSPWLQAPQTTPRRLVPLRVPGYRPPRHTRLDNAGRPLQALTLGKRRRPSLPCRRHRRRAWHYTPFPCEHVVSGVQARSTGVQGERGVAWARARPGVKNKMAPPEASRVRITHGWPRTRGYRHPSRGVILFSNIPVAGSAPQMTAGDRR